jgi:hypothetical protein
LLAKMPSTKFLSTDDRIFYVERDIANQYVTTKFKEDEEVVPWPSSDLQEMPRPVLREECSQEEFQSFTQQWNLYARYHSGMDVREL